MAEVSNKGSLGVDMLHGPLLKKILIFAFPVAVSSLLQQLFNAADVAVVGYFAGSTAQAAVGSNVAAINLIINAFIGLTVGANAVLGQYIGQRNHAFIKEAVSTIMTLGFISGIALIVIGQIVSVPMLKVTGSPPDVFDQAVLYLRIYFVGMPFAMTYNFGSAVLRSRGDTKRPLAALALAGIVNVILNIILVRNFQLGVAGVAIATDVSQLLSGVMVLYYLMTEAEPFRFSFKSLSINKRHLQKIVAIGLPAGLQGMVFSFSNVCIQSGINSFGSAAMAGCTISQNFEFMGFYLINAYNQSAVTFTSQNYGAGNEERCRKIYRLCISAAVITVLIFSGLTVSTRHILIGLFTGDAAAAEYASLRMVPLIGLQFIAVSYEVTASAMRGRGHSLLPALITIAGTCLFRLLWVYAFFPMNRTFMMLMGVYPVSWVITGTAMVAAYLHLVKKGLPH